MPFSNLGTSGDITISSDSAVSRRRGKGGDHPVTCGDAPFKDAEAGATSFPPLQQSDRSRSTAELNSSSAMWQVSVCFSQEFVVSDLPLLAA